MMQGSTWKSVLLLICSLCFQLAAASAASESDSPTLQERARHHGGHFVVPKVWHNANIAHGVLMGIPVLLIFPAGGLFIRFSKSRYTFWIHAGLQVTGLVIALGGFATGLWTALLHKKLFTHPHSTWGTCIVAFWVVQPISGWMHHRGYIRKGGPTLWTTVHRWLGRINMIMAIINLVVGLQYAGNSLQALEGCSTIAAVVGAVYMSAIVWWYLTQTPVPPKEELEGPVKLIEMEIQKV